MISFKSLHRVNWIIFKGYMYVLFFLWNKLFLASFFIFPQGIPSLSETLNSKTKIKIILHIFISPTARQKQQILGGKNVMATPKQHKLKFKWQPSRKTFSMFKINALQTEQQLTFFFQDKKMQVKKFISKTFSKVIKDCLF